MTVFEAVRNRRSIRRFRKDSIPDDIEQRLVDSLIWAPSAGNLQARKFYFVKDGEVKQALSAAALGQHFIAKAPLVVVGCTDSRIATQYGDRGVHLYTIQDVACSIMGMMLVAHEMGLGTVWVGAFHDDAVADVLNLPGHLHPVALVPAGWPEKTASTPPRVAREEAIVVL